MHKKERQRDRLPEKSHVKGNQQCPTFSPLFKSWISRHYREHNFLAIRGYIKVVGPQATACNQLALHTRTSSLSSGGSGPSTIRPINGCISIRAHLMLGLVFKLHTYILKLVESRLTNGRYCSWHGFLHQRMNTNGTGTKWFIFLKQ